MKSCKEKKREDKNQLFKKIQDSRCFTTNSQAGKDPANVVHRPGVGVLSKLEKS